MDKYICIYCGSSLSETEGREQAASENKIICPGCGMRYRIEEDNTMHISEEQLPRKAVMISIQPQWCNKIVSGEKVLEIRKTRPKLQPPFKCYIYKTCGGGVVAEFICDRIRCISANDFVVREDAERALEGSGLTRQEAKDYAGWKRGTLVYDCKPLYGWHISDLKVYDKPKDLGDFTVERNTKNWALTKKLEKAPQSWCYVLAHNKN